MIVRGVVARGLCVSSDSSPALSKPTMTYAAINAEMSSGTTYPVVLPRFVVCRTTDGPRSALVVNNTMISTTPMISQVTPTELTTAVIRTLVAFSSVVADEQETAQDDRVRGAVLRRQRGVGADQLEAGPDRGQHHLQGDRRGGHRDDLRDHHRPAGEPADDGAAETPGPLVDRAGERVARGEFGEAERDHQLADEHRRPGPEEGRAAEAEAEAEQLEDGRQDGHEREAGGERRVAADPARELLGVAESAQVVGAVPWRWVRSVFQGWLTFRPPSDRPGMHTAARGLQGLPGFCPAVERRRRDSAVSPLGPGLPSPAAEP